MLSTMAALLLLGSIDQGIFPDLGSRVQIHAPSWPVSDGPLAVRIDEKHRLMTISQGSVALSAYPIAVSAEQLSALARTPNSCLLYTSCDQL